MSLITGERTPSVTMRGYLSEWDSAREPWPMTYVVVETAPQRWMATITLPDLAEVLDGRPDAHLRDVPYRWDGEELVVMFGPVHVRGAEGPWRWLGSHLLTTAEGAAGLYEAPSARPWSGPTAEVPVRQVEVPRRPRILPDDEGVLPDALLADACGLSQEAFDDVLGTGWQRWRGSWEPAFDPELFLWGQPAQLAAELYVDGTVRIGRPAGRWPRPGDLVMEAADAVTIDPATVTGSMFESLVKDLVRRRRRSFGWCRYCGGLFPPEHRLERDVCHGCGTEVFGVVY